MSGRDDNDGVLLSDHHVRQAFDSFTEGGGRYLNNTQIGAALRSLGLMTPDDELRNIVAEVIHESIGGSINAVLANIHKRSVDFEKFSKIASRVYMLEQLSSGINNHHGLFQPSESELEEYRKAFLTFDRDNTGYVRLDHLGLILHQIGLHTTESELKVIRAEMDRDATGLMNFAHFLVMVARLKQDEAAMDELLEAFKVFDPNDEGVVNVADLSDDMSVMCDSMSSRDIRELLYGNMDFIDNNGMLDYRRLVHAMVKSMTI